MVIPTFIGWKIYYSDGTTFSSKDGKPKDAPKTDIQIITVFYNPKVSTDPTHPDFNRNYRKMWQSQDWYWIKAGNPPTFGRTNRPEDIPKGVVTFESGLSLEWEPFLKAAWKDWDWDVA